MKLSTAIVQIASSQVGVQEIDGTNCGPMVDQYKTATNLSPHEAWPWCAAFVCWVVREAMTLAGGSYTFKRPTTAGAFALVGWSLSQDRSTQTRREPGNDIQPGDIIVFRFSHCGFATGQPDADGYFNTIEGNTDVAGSREGGGVFRKRRHISKVLARIRFTV